jgi:hypothetical protein
MAVDFSKLLEAVGVDTAGVYQQGVNFLLQQAADWSRIPTRLARIGAARTLIANAAVQQNKPDVAAKMAAVGSALTQLQTAYNNGSSQVADVVDQVRVLPPGAVPPVSLAAPAAKAAALVSAVTKGATALEGQIASAASQVLTPAQIAQLKAGGLNFPAFMGVQIGTLVKYLIIGVPVYLLLRGRRSRSGGSVSW